MKIIGNAQFAADRAVVWQALNDPAVLVRCIPGCQRLEALGDDAYTLTVAAGVGSIKGVYDGQVRLTDQQQPGSFRMHAQGAGAAGTIEADAARDARGVGGRRGVDDLRRGRRRRRDDRRRRPADAGGGARSGWPRSCFRNVENAVSARTPGGSATEGRRHRPCTARAVRRTLFTTTQGRRPDRRRFVRAGSAGGGGVRAGGSRRSARWISRRWHA